LTANRNLRVLSFCFSGTPAASPPATIKDAATMNSFIKFMSLSLQILGNGPCCRQTEDPAVFYSIPDAGYRLSDFLIFYPPPALAAEKKPSTDYADYAD